MQTALQEMLRHLTSLSMPFDFVRVAAPTGCAAFNMHFNATTIHRLIHHFRLGTFLPVARQIVGKTPRGFERDTYIVLRRIQYDWASIHGPHR